MKRFRVCCSSAEVKKKTKTVCSVLSRSTSAPEILEMFSENEMSNPASSTLDALTAVCHAAAHAHTAEICCLTTLVIVTLWYQWSAAAIQNNLVLFCFTCSSSFHHLCVAVSKCAFRGAHFVHLINMGK